MNPFTRRLISIFGAPLLALGAGLLLSSIALLLIDESPTAAFTTMFEYGLYDGDRGVQWKSIIEILNTAVPLYLAGLAAAVGFRMGLFNIGVEGQYAMAGLFAAYFGAKISAPGFIHIPLILLIAMVTGSAWAGIAGLLKVKRGVNEVIATIMLNFIAFNLISWLFFNYWRDPRSVGQLNVVTTRLPESGHMPNLNWVFTSFGIDVPGNTSLTGMLVVAILAGIVFWFVLNRTRFGYDLRASGANPGASRASGVDAQGMVLRAMLVSGAFAGLVGMTAIVSDAHLYATDFPKNYGFDGIAVALLGRNSASGAAMAALLFGFLRRGGQALLGENIPQEIVTIMTGSMIFAAVIAFELVTRWSQRQEAIALAEAVESHDTVVAGA